MNGPSVNQMNVISQGAIKSNPLQRCHRVVRKVASVHRRPGGRHLVMPARHVHFIQEFE